MLRTLFYSTSFVLSLPFQFHPMGHGHLLLLLLPFLLYSSSAADDGATMLKLAGSIKPLPRGWSTKSAADFCNWDGIKCDSSKTRVTSINLFKHELSGTLPTELSTLTELQSLSLQNNQLTGAFPPLGNLSNLQEIFIDDNSFTSIPAGFFKGLRSLQTLSIGKNAQLKPWQLSNDLAESTSLTTFEASNCSIIGTIPDIFGSLMSLQNLRLSYNNLTGFLPPSFAKSGIQNLWLNNQQVGLSGSIEVIASMTQLSQVWLQKNQFSGPIPDLSNATSIFDLQLRDNLLTGIVPASLVSLPSLVNVSLSNNQFLGPVPVFPKSVTEVLVNGTNKFCADTGPCDAQVMTLLQIAGDFGYPEILSSKWGASNDACSWPFINCDLQTKNVVNVNLGKQGFSGVISPAFANLTSLRNLMLNDNKLTGRIPDFLAKMPRLVVLDVANNNLSEQVPKFSSSVKLTTKPGNPFLGTDVDTTPASPGNPGETYIPSGSTSGGRTGGTKVHWGLIAGIIAAILILIVVSLFILYGYKTRQGSLGMVSKRGNRMSLIKNRVGGGVNGYNEIHGELHSQSSDNNSDRKMFEGGNVAVPIEVLRQVTDDFAENNIIGRGGFGVVYKGELHDGTKIAVKRMESTLMGTKGLNEFQAEIAVLTKVRHRHLVALLGYCINGNERLLVYEYMPQGTLGQHLFEHHNHVYSPLTWKQRITIALDVARGVEYLHSLAQQSFIHRDLKSSNILLGDDMRAKVADFGLVKSAPDGKYSMETRLAGTFGYLAPEYASTGRVTTKVDVYAFGVVLMEIITGRKPLDDRMPDENAHLVTWFRRILTNKANIPKAIDEFLNPDEETLASIYSVAELAGHCTAREPYQRPDMGHAVNVLSPLVEQWRPAASQEEDQGFGIDLGMGLPAVLERWQAEEGSSMMFNETSYSQTHSSIPSRPSGFPDTFSSGDCR